MSDKLEKRIDELKKTLKERGFHGIASVNCTAVPDVVVDELMPCLPDNEFKILMCIIRQTYGFRRDSANIPIEQMIKSAGLSKQQVLFALRTLKELNVIKTETSPENGLETANYSFNLERWGVCES